jgi:predicted phage baseplate assembly protein
MPIRPPALDDRSFNDLVADMVRRVQAHTPEWTDIREGDPGRTLIDLLAWMGDTILYRVNLIPERQRLAFLRLLGKPLRPAMPAQGLVQVTIDDPAITDLTILPMRHPIAKPVHFELDTELAVLPIEGRTYIKRRPGAAERAQLSALLNDLKELYSISGSPEAYVTTQVFVGGTAEPAGRDFVAESIDKCLWFALLAPTPEDAAKAAVRRTLGGGEKKRRVALSVGLSPTIGAVQPLEAVSTRAPIPHVWEIASAGGDGTDYLPLELLSDGTSGLTQPGVIRLLLPGDDDFGVPSNDVIGDVDAGVGDRPPRIDDPVTARRLVAWIRLRPLPIARLSTLRLSWAGTNAVTVTQRKTYGRQEIGRGSGLSGQELSLGATNVETASLVVEVEEEEGLRVWPLVADIAMAGRGQRACAVDAEAGTVRFGDGVSGAVPAPGRAIHVAYMRAGGGAAGNLAAGSLKSVTGPVPTIKLKLNQPLQLFHGLDAETLDRAEARIPAELRHGDRAVTRGDFAMLAAATPGLNVGRVEVLERFKPHQRRDKLPGVVSVMVIPSRAGTEKPAPRPDRPMLETVHSWLDARRPLGTELYVIAPEYVPLGISAAVELVDPANRDAVLEMVSEAIRLVLWPLPPGGPDGQGWPLGGMIDDRLIETAMARVPGVRNVAPITMFTRTARGAWTPVAEDKTARGRIPLEPWQLPELAMLSVAVGGTSSTTLVPPGASDGGIAVPVVPELC